MLYDQWAPVDLPEANRLTFHRLSIDTDYANNVLEEKNKSYRLGIDYFGAPLQSAAIFPENGIPVLYLLDATGAVWKLRTPVNLKHLHNSPIGALAALTDGKYDWSAPCKADQCDRKAITLKSVH
jgi:hypothetical protein